MKKAIFGLSLLVTASALAQEATSKIAALRRLAESPPSQTSVFDHVVFNGKTYVRHRYTLTTIGQDWQLIAERSLDAPVQTGKEPRIPYPEPNSQEALEMVRGLRPAPPSYRTRAVIVKLAGKVGSYTDDYGGESHESLWEEGTVNYLTSFGLSHGGWVGPRELRWNGEREFSLQKEDRIIEGTIILNEHGQMARVLLMFRGAAIDIDYSYTAPADIEPYSWTVSGPSDGWQTVTRTSRKPATKFPDAGLQPHAPR